MGKRDISEQFKNAKNRGKCDFVATYSVNNTPVLRGFFYFLVGYPNVDVLCSVFVWVSFVFAFLAFTKFLETNSGRSQLQQSWIDVYLIRKMRLELVLS